MKIETEDDRKKKEADSETTMRALKKCLLLEGKVVKGFGRGGKLLNCPTANLDVENLDDALGEHSTGIYFGWAVRNLNVVLDSSISLYFFIN